MSDPYDAIPDGTAVKLPKFPESRPNCCHVALAISVAVALLLLAIIVLPCGPYSGELPAPGPAAPESPVGPSPAVPPKAIKSEYVPKQEPTPADKKLSVSIEQEGGEQTPEGWTAPVGKIIRLRVAGNSTRRVWDDEYLKAEMAFTAEDGQILDFSSGTPGTFTFYLAASDEDESILARHRVIIGQRPVPPPGPGPVPTPVPVPVPVSEKRCVLIVYESKAVTPAESRTYTNLRDGTAAAYLKSKGHMLDICDQNKPPANKYAPFGKLPELLIFDAANPAVPLFRGPMPATADNVIEQLTRTGG